MNVKKCSPLDPASVEKRLGEHVDAVLSPRRSAAGPAKALAGFSREQQELVLHWVGVIARTNAELAYQFAAHAPQGLGRMDRDGVEAWLIRAMDVYDKRGLSHGVRVLQAVEGFAAEHRLRATGLALEGIVGILENFLRGLNGRALRITAGEVTHTDTETLFLPPLLNRFTSREENFRLFKATAVHQWAQAWYGTWRTEMVDPLCELAGAPRALALFHALETERLDACIAREYPGLLREMNQLRAALDPAPPADWRQRTAPLRSPGAGAAESLRLARELVGQMTPPIVCYRGALVPDEVRAVIEARLAHDRDRFRAGLARIVDALGQRIAAAQRTDDPRSDRFALARIPDPEEPEGSSFELLLEDRPIEPPEDLRSVMTSIIQDLGAIPQDYLVAAEPGAHHARSEGRSPDDALNGTHHQEGALVYDEWDAARQHYRKGWCVLREKDVHPGSPAFVGETLARHRGIVESLRRSFQILRGEEKLLRRQAFGEDIDIDALVEACADLSHGVEMTDRLFTKIQRDERSIAVMIMVDMSGSTRGWVNDAERESLALLCEALEILGDRYAIYGFSGMTRKRCEIYRVKRFDEPYSDEVRARINGILPQHYTRMGVAIRHLGALLGGVEARTKLLITLSDGKPEDWDGYRGDYGIEDTRQALFEARRDGIHPFCITIDEEARDYLPHMYGAANYVIIDDVRKLPLKVTGIYRKLTT